MQPQIRTRVITVGLDAEGASVVEECRERGYNVNALVRRLILNFGREQNILPDVKNDGKRDGKRE